MTKIERQQSLFAGLKERLGEVSSADVAAILALREVENCEPELTIETIDSLNERLCKRLREKIAAAKY
jgi:isopropylmalate/homocitrate/citramalate synthase